MSHGEESPYITTTTPIRLLSANDGEAVMQLDEDGLFDRDKTIPDSITVIDLGPDGPPQSRTVFGTVPNTFVGPPHMAMSKDGRLGFVTNHSWRFEDPTYLTTDFGQLPADRQNVLSVVDLASPELTVLEQVSMPPHPWMARMHPDGEHVIVCCWREFHVFKISGRSVELVKVNKSHLIQVGFDISPKGDRLIATALSHDYTEETEDDDIDIQIYLFSVAGDRITFLHRVMVYPAVGRIDGPFSPRFSPDGQRVLILNGNGTSDKGILDALLSIDMSMAKPAVTEVIPQVADGLESIAIHPDGHMAVVTCLGNNVNSNAAQAFARLAVIDLKSKPMRMLSQTPVEAWPEGIEFSPTGDKLFVGCTYAHHIAVYDVDGYRLTRSPYILPTGHGHSSLAIGPQSGE
jgi:DNA-binding beta-propeller fold protein YncE